MIFRGQARPGHGYRFGDRSCLTTWLAAGHSASSRATPVPRPLGGPAVHLEAPAAVRDHEDRNECQDVTAVEAKRCLLVTEPDQGPRGQM